MTPQQIDALPAGRELDALVLVHVMGWKWWQYKQARKCQLIAPTMQSEETGTHGLYVDWPPEAERFRGWDFSVGYGTAPHVSTDIAAAWTVVEAMKAKGYSVTMWDCPDYSPPLSPGVLMRRGIHPPKRYLHYDDNGTSCSQSGALPLCIARCALKAVFAAKAQEASCKT